MKPAQGLPNLKLRLSGKGGGNLIRRFMNFVLDETGDYKFELYKNTELLKSTKLSVIRIKEHERGMSN